MGRKLKEEIHQETDFASLEEEVFLALQRTSRAVLEPWAGFLKRQAGLTPSQYNVLRILRGAHPDGRTCGEISERLVTRDPDVTRIVDRLEKRGLVQRERGTDDRRVVRVSITARGLGALETLDGTVSDMPQKLLGGLGRRRLRSLVDLLDAVREELGEFP